MLRVASAGRGLSLTQLRICRSYRGTAAHLQPLPADKGNVTPSKTATKEEDGAQADGNLDGNLKKIQQFGAENEISKISKFFFKVRDPEALLTASVQQLHSSKGQEDEIKNKKGPAFIYIADTLLKVRSPLLLRLLPIIEQNEAAIKLFGTKRLLQACKILAYDLKYSDDKVSIDERKYTLSSTLFRPVDHKYRKAYRTSVDFPTDKFLTFFSISNKYDMDFLHLHLTTRHFVRWLRVTKVEESRLRLRLNSFFDLVLEKYKYDPAMTTAILLSNIHEFTESESANKAVRRYPYIIFFTACSWLIKHGITYDLQRLHAFAKQFPNLVNPTMVPHDIYSEGIVTMFEHFSQSTLPEFNSAVHANRELTPTQLQQAKLMATLGKQNNFKSAKLRGTFLHTANAFGYYNLTKAVLQEYYSEYVWLGTMVLNNCIRTFINIGDHATCKELILMTSAEKKLVKLLSVKMAMAEMTPTTSTTTIPTPDTSIATESSDIELSEEEEGKFAYQASIAAQASQLDDSISFPPTELDVGINVSTLSSYITGLEYYYIAKEKAAGGVRVSDAQSDDFDKHVSIQILSLLQQMNEYKIIPYISLFNRILALNKKYLQNLSIPHMCVQLALRPGKIQPSDMRSTAVKQWKSRGNRGNDVEKHMQSVGGNPSTSSTFDPNAVAMSENGTAAVDLQTQASQAFVLLELLEKVCEDYNRFNQIGNIKFVMEKMLALGMKPSETLIRTVMHAYLLHGKYDDVVDFFESLPERKVVRTFDHAVMVMEALAKQGRLHDAWRSMTALKGPIMHSMNQIYHEHESSQAQDKLLFKKSKYLLAQCDQCLHQIAFITQSPPMAKGKPEVDMGHVKICKEDLLASILFCIDMILRAYAFSTWDVTNVRNNQDQLAMKLYQFKQSNDPMVVNIVFSKIKSLGKRAEDLIDYVSSIDGTAADRIL